MKSQIEADSTSQKMDNLFETLTLNYCWWNEHLNIQKLFLDKRNYAFDA